ncbi:MAG TPA: hypothetical protein VGC66_23880 [Pyrinomonadaceae bacterium]|jgi:hypothetical protein
MCERQRLTVRLHTGGRYFTCPYCSRVREHPPFDLHYYMEGHAFCYWCVRWMKIERDGTGKTEEAV